MQRRFRLPIVAPMLAPSLAVLLLTVVGCSSNPSPNPTPGADSDACRGDLPSRLTISEGGRRSLTRRADVTYEGVGGAVVTLEDDAVSVRAPYAAQVAGADAALAPGLQLGCGALLPIDLRPLAWSSVATWTNASGPPAREYGSWWLDDSPGAAALVIFGGFHYRPKQFTPANDAWRFDFATGGWTALAGDALPKLPGSRVAAIPGERAVLLYGGSAATESGAIETPPSLYRIDYDDQKLTPTPVAELGEAVGSYTGAFLHDPKRARWLSLCGVSSQLGPHCLVHAYTKETGLRAVATTGAAPKGRSGFHYAYDEASDRVILFGGQDGSQNEDIDGETWALSLAVTPPTWTRLFANGKGPMKRRNGAFALDTLGRRLFVWGGTPDGAKSIGGVQVLTLDPGAEAWTDIATPSEVPSRTSGFGVHDAPRGRVLFGFGNDAALYQDLWSLDVANDAASNVSR